MMISYIAIMKKEVKFIGLLIIVFSMLVMSCSKEEDESLEEVQTVHGGVYYHNLSIQENLDSGVTIAAVLVNNPKDSLYGKHYQEGLIFFVDSATARGIVTTNYDICSSCTWDKSVHYNTGARDSVIWSAIANTNAIVNLQGDSAYAAFYCADLKQYASSNYDWYLPSRDELIFIMHHLYYAGFGNFDENTNLSYWSSTEVAADKAMSSQFSFFFPIISTETIKSAPLQVRPVHYF